MEIIAKEIEKCEECKKNKIGLPVPGEGNENAKIFFIGEAPGIEESKTGKPFVGRAGKFLDKLLFLAKLKREEIFITSPIKYYPGKRKIQAKEILHGRTHLLKQIEIINPKIIVALGNVALKALYPDKDLRISKVRGKILKWNNKIVFPTYHPAAAMRFPKIKEVAEKDFRKLAKLLKNLSG